MADQINATSTFGMRAWVERGYSKSKIAPASAIGSTLFRGTDWIYTCRSATTNVSDLWRGGVRYDGLTNEAEILANGGTRHYDPTFGVSYINGTATKSTWGDAKIGLSTGQRFLWMCEDSISMYAKTNWLVQNGWGGICPYSVTEDVNPWLPKPRRLNAHRGIVAALGRIGSTAPTGSFTASPDTLTFGGGTTTLSWTSNNADSASIDQGIGPVPVNGSRVVTVTTTKTFRLTLTGAGGVATYDITVHVGLPGGQGVQDVTAQGTPIAFVTAPLGGGNHDIEVIRDGVMPPVGTNAPGEQYDTYTDGSARATDWIGYQFSSSRTFRQLLFQEGMHFSNGGWFNQIRVQVRSGSVWSDVDSLTISPAYAGAGAPDFSTYEMVFAPTTGERIRIIGEPGGSGYFISVAELRVFAITTSDTPPGGPPVPQDYALSQNYPNPFNGETRIVYAVPGGVGSTTPVSLAVYDMLGQEMVTLVNGAQTPGEYTVSFDAARLPSGVYLYRLTAGGFSEMKKMILLR